MSDALRAGDMAEATRQVGLLRSLRGPQPRTPEKQRLLERINKLAEENEIRTDVSPS